MSEEKQDKVTGVFSAKGQSHSIPRKTGKPAAFSYPYGGDVLATDFEELGVRATANCNEVTYEDS